MGPLSLSSYSLLLDAKDSLRVGPYDHSRSLRLVLARFHSLARNRMSSSLEEEALPEHAYYCFEVINAQLNNSEPIEPEFDDSLEL